VESIVRKLLSVISAALAAVAGLIWLGAPTAHADTTPRLRIMPIGDSVTWGVGSSSTSSYRADLWNRITGAGYSLDFVGGARSGALPDPDNEGHSGWRIDQVADLVPCGVAGSRPNMVTLHLGTNDMGQDYQVGQAPQRLGALIDRIVAADPGVTVLVASLVPSADPAVESRIAAFNQQIPGLVAQRQNAGAHIRYVDMSAVTTANLSDPLHPNDEGYQKMSAAFFAGVQQSLDAGWVTDPGPPTVGCVQGAIRGVQSVRCLDVHGGGAANGAPAGLWDCTEGASQQQWTTTATREIRVFGDKCLDASGGGTADGTPVLIWDCTGGPNQQWTVGLDGTIVGAASGKCLEAAAQGTANDTPARVWNCNGGTNQRWATSIKGALRGAESGRCADVSGGSTAPGAALALWECNGAGNQAWTATVSGQLTVFDNRCLDVKGGDTADGTTVVIWNCTDAGHQQWSLEADGTVRSAVSGKCLDVAAHGTANNTALGIWTCTGSANQKWSR
jgi:lysophospholipase L1-like esterase